MKNLFPPVREKKPHTFTDLYSPLSLPSTSETRRAASDLGLHTGRGLSQQAALWLRPDHSGDAWIRRGRDGGGAEQQGLTLKLFLLSFAFSV